MIARIRDCRIQLSSGSTSIFSSESSSTAFVESEVSPFPASTTVDPGLPDSTTINHSLPTSSRIRNRPISPDRPPSEAGDGVDEPYGPYSYPLNLDFASRPRPTNPPWDRAPGESRFRPNRPANDNEEATNIPAKGSAMANTINPANDDEPALLPPPSNSATPLSTSPFNDNVKVPEDTQLAPPRPYQPNPSTSSAPQPNYGYIANNNDNPIAISSSPTQPPPAPQPITSTPDPYADDGYPSNRRMWPYRAEQDEQHANAALKRSASTMGETDDNTSVWSTWRQLLRWF